MARSDSHGTLKSLSDQLCIGYRCLWFSKLIIFNWSFSLKVTFIKLTSRLHGVAKGFFQWNFLFFLRSVGWWSLKYILLVWDRKWKFWDLNESLGTENVSFGAKNESFGTENLNFGTENKSFVRENEFWDKKWEFGTKEINNWDGK